MIDSLGVYPVLLGLTGFCFVLPSFSGFYGVLLSFTKIHFVLLSISLGYRVLPSFLLVGLGIKKSNSVLPSFNGVLMDFFPV